MKKTIICSISLLLLIRCEAVCAFSYSGEKIVTCNGGCGPVMDVYKGAINVSRLGSWTPLNPDNADTVYMKKGESIVIRLFIGGSGDLGHCSLQDIKWYKNNVQFDSNQTSYTASSQGSYTCSFKSNGSPVIYSGTILVVFDNATGIPVNDKKDLSVAVFPNPSDRIFNVEINPAEKETLRLEVVTILGEVIYSREMEVINAENHFVIDLSGHEDGIYFMFIRRKGIEICNKKLIFAN